MDEESNKKKISILYWLQQKIIKFQNVTTTDKMFFCKHLSLMIKAGISISKSLKTLALQTNNKGFSFILNDICKKVEEGESLAKALQRHEKIFGHLFINMIKSGELSGKLEEVLEQIFIQLKKSHELVSKVRNALIYPIIVVIAMFGIGIAMIVFVIPKITAVFKESDAQLPFATKILIAISDTLAQHGVISFLSFIIVLVIIIKLLRTNIGKKFLSNFCLRTPIIAPITKKINLARFSRTISSLLKTDIPIIESFKITSEVMGNTKYKKGISNISEDIKNGISIKEAMTKYDNIFPPIILQMVAIGEETGSLDKILDEIALFYEEEVQEIMNTLPSILEPILMLLLGGGVAFMAVAIIMPMYSLTQQI